jgi:4-hydroxy-tetrahydrodipicolinate synthase
MVTAFKKGDVDLARELNARLLESWAFESGDLNPNPIPTKAMLRTMGLPAGQTRPPMGPCPDGLEDRAREVLKSLRG